MGRDLQGDPGPPSQRRRRLPVRYLALLGIGAVAVNTVGLSAYAAVASIRTGDASLVAIDAIAVRHHDADTDVHAVYAHTLAAVDDGRLVPADLLTEVAGHAARVHGSLVTNRQAARAALPPGSSLPTALDRLAQQSDAFSAQATGLAQLARTRPEDARRALPAFNAAFESLDEAFGATADDLSDQVAATRADASRRLRQAVVTIVAAVGGALALMTLLGGLIMRVDGRLARAARREAELHQFAAELHSAFEMVDSEPDACQVSAEALAIAGGRAELLLADSSRSSITTVATGPGAAPGCGIRSPWECVAVRRGQRMLYPDGDALGACRKLRGRPEGPVSAVCIPVAFMGRALGVLHSTTAPGALHDATMIQQLTTIADQTGHRIGTIRAFDRSQLRASTDGLTGLLNRRAVEERIREMIAAAPTASYAVAMADLDHFKHLNDTYGHDAGDQALRRFATLLKQSVRAEDVAGRYGGEEFVVFFPGATADLAADVLQRVRAELAAVNALGSSAPVTASFGVAAGDEGTDFADVLVRADARLRRAKQLGRDRVVCTDGADGADGDASPEPPGGSAPALGRPPRPRVPEPTEPTEPTEPAENQLVP